MLSRYNFAAVNTRYFLHTTLLQRIQYRWFELSLNQCTLFADYNIIFHKDFREATNKCLFNTVIFICLYKILYWRKCNQRLWFILWKQLFYHWFYFLGPTFLLIKHNSCLWYESLKNCSGSQIVLKPVDWRYF